MAPTAVIVRQDQFLTAQAINVLVSQAKPGTCAFCSKVSYRISVCFADENECQTAGICGGNGTCVDVEGGFQCLCAAGFAPGAMQACEDVDECRERTHHCAFRCINTHGSYRCGKLTRPI